MSKKSSKKVSVMPLGDRVLVKPEVTENEKSVSGIIIPDSARQEKPEQGEVIAVGEGRRNERGELIPMRVKVGQTIMFEKYSFTTIKINDEECLVGPEASILAIIQ